MKKRLVFSLLVLLTVVLGGCSRGNKDSEIHVLATAIPHEEILIVAKPLLKDLGYNLVITVTDDYYVPNVAVANKSVDANFFQHMPFLDNYNNGASDSKKLVNVAEVHIEPLAGYSKNINSLDELNSGNHQVLISNSLADHGRILTILKNAGIIELNSSVNTLTAKLSDITSKPEGLTFREVAPELLVTTYNNEASLSLAFINGNFALEANLPVTQKVIVESATNNPYVNILAVLKGNEESPKIKALVSVLTSDTIKNFITNKYGGAVIPS